MPFQTGRKKTGGRQKGTKNELKLNVINKAEVLGISPYEILLLFAAGDWKRLGYKGETYTIISTSNIINQYYTIEPSVRAKAAAEACQYLYPKLKSIEVDNVQERDRPLADKTDDEIDGM